MTTTDAPPIKSHEAARGARLRRLTAIDLTYKAICADITAEATHGWGATIAASCARIAEAMEGLEVDDDGNLIGNPLRVLLATRKIIREIEPMTHTWWIGDFRLANTLVDLEECRLAERASFDFDMSPRPADVEASREAPTDSSLTTAGPDELDGIQWGAENFGAPMNCIWIDTPPETGKES